MSKVISDPKSIRQFQRQLGQFNRELENISVRLKNNLNTLGNDWRDSEFEKFRANMDEMLRIMKRYQQQSNDYVRYLDKKAEPLERFLGQG